MSVIAAAYNEEKRLDGTLRSLVAQTLEDFEVVVVDDGSTDGTLALLEEWARRDDRIVVVRASHEGLTRSLNRSIEAARAPIVARHDFGDFSHPERLARQVGFLERHTDHVLVGIQPEFVDRGGCVICRSRLPQSDEALRTEAASFIGAAIAARTDLVRVIGGYRPFFRYSQDADLHLRLMEKGRVANLPDHLYSILAEVSASISSTRGFSQLQYLELACEFARERRIRGSDPLMRGESGPRVREPTRLERVRYQLSFKWYHLAARLRYENKPARAYVVGVGSALLVPARLSQWLKRGGRRLRRWLSR